MKRNQKGYYPIQHEGVQYLLVSVTTVLKRVLNKPALYFWYGKHGNQKCKQILNESSGFGTAIHKFIYWDLFERKGNDQYAISSDMSQCVNNYYAFKKKYKPEPIVGEQTVYSLQHGYAGQMDLLCRVTDGHKKKCVLLDWKTSSGIYEDHELQLQAYNTALLEMKNNKWETPDELWCARLDKDGPIDYNKDIGKYAPCPKAFKAFLGLLESFNWLKSRKEK